MGSKWSGSVRSTSRDVDSRTEAIASSSASGSKASLSSDAKAIWSSLPPPTQTSLFRRYLLYGRTTLTLLSFGGAAGATAIWYLSYSLGKKLDGLYSKSKPHQLDKQKHFYVSRADGSPDEVSSILDEELEVVEDTSGETKFNLKEPENPLVRFRDKAKKLFVKTKDDIGKKFEKGAFHLNHHMSDLRGDDPDTLMKVTLSRTETVWKLGIHALATLGHEKWRNDDFWRVAQSLDPKSIIAISQYPDVDLRFFLPIKKFPHVAKKGGVYGNLYPLLARLPLEFTDSATKYFTELALKSWRKEIKDSEEEDEDEIHHEDFFLGGDYLEYREAVELIEMTQNKKEHLSCLQALICHSKPENNHDLFLKLPILPYLLELVSSVDCDSTRLLVAQIIGNVACRPEAIPSLVVSGWVGLLVKWRQSQQSAFQLQLAAARALINIHGSYFLAHQEWNLSNDASIKGNSASSNRVPYLKEGVYAYEPTQSFFTGDFNADIVFVHGLLGGAAYTWRQSVACDDKDVEGELSGKKPKGTCPTSFSKCWPKDWLAKDVPGVRMIGVDYSTQLFDWEPVHPYETPKERTIAARAKELLTKLEAADVGKKRPIVWVTHSMGGLLVKEILRLAEERREDDPILVNSSGVIFYGTPHKGSPLANHGNNFYYIVFPTIEVQELSESNRDYLDGLNEHFGNLVNKGMQSLSFAELKPTLLGDFVSDSLSMHLVPPDSANPNFGQFIPVDSDHMNICKPSGTTDCFLYSMTVNFIKDCIEKQMIRSAIKLASSALNTDVDEGVTEEERHDLDHGMWT